MEKETLALLLAPQHLDVNVGSSMPLAVYTDHNPLVLLARMYNHNQRLMRCALLVQENNLEIKHKRGADDGSGWCPVSVLGGLKTWFYGNGCYHLPVSPSSSFVSLCCNAISWEVGQLQRISWLSEGTDGNIKKSYISVYCNYSHFYNFFYTFIFLSFIFLHIFTKVWEDSNLQHFLHNRSYNTTCWVYLILKICRHYFF